jgi:hypothetical protein
LPWAKDNGFSEKQRLFHHYYLYGKKEGRFSNLEEKEKYRGSENVLRGRDEDIDLRDLEKYIIEEEQNVDGYIHEWNRHYILNRYIEEVISNMKDEEKNQYIYKNLFNQLDKLDNISLNEKINKTHPQIILSAINE